MTGEGRLLLGLLERVVAPAATLCGGVTNAHARFILPCQKVPVSFHSPVHQTHRCAYPHQHPESPCECKSTATRSRSRNRSPTPTPRCLLPANVAHALSAHQSPTTQPPPPTTPSPTSSYNTTSQKYATLQNSIITIIVLLLHLQAPRVVQHLRATLHVQSLPTLKLKLMMMTKKLTTKMTT